MKKILITGANSYIGTSFEKYIKENFLGQYVVDTVDMVDREWRKKDFSGYDSVFHVAGIAHSDNGKISAEKERLYYAVNTDLTVETAKKAKADGVKQFIFMSSVIVYGESTPIGKIKVITKNTSVSPANCYGDSKVQAENGILPLQDNDFKVCVLRPPMIYGKGSKGNYPKLAKLAVKMPVFPYVKNQRSMLYIEVLCEFVRLMVENEEEGVFWPQNKEYVCTADMVKIIAKVHGRKMCLTSLFNFIIKLLRRCLEILLTTNLCQNTNRIIGWLILKNRLEEQKNKRHILVVSQYFHPEQMRINDICQEWVNRGYKVTVLTGVPNYPKGKFYDGYNCWKKTRENWNGIEIVRIPIIARGNNAIKLILNYLSFVISGYFWSVFNKVRADIVYIYEVSPMMQALPGLWYAKKNKIPCILYIMDLWPENVEYVAGISNKFILSSIEKMCQYIYKNSDMILTSSRSFIDILLGRKVFSNKLKFWPQYAEDFYKPEEKSKNEIPVDGKFNILFAGNIGVSQGLNILPEVAKILKQKNIDVRFNILGDGRFKESLILLVKKNNTQDMFNFINKTAPENVPFYIANSDVLLISLIRNESFAATIPAKLQSYLACGKPILVSADGEIQEIVRQAEAGLCSDSGDTQGLANIIEEMVNLPEEYRDKMGNNAREYSQKEFNKKNRLEEIDKWIEELIGQN